MGGDTPASRNCLDFRNQDEPSSTVVYVTSAVFGFRNLREVERYIQVAYLITFEVFVVTFCLASDYLKA